MTQHSEWIVGIDLGDRVSVYCKINGRTGEFEEGDFRMSPEEVREHFEPWERMRVVMEVGTHSRWMLRVLTEMGFDVVVADPRRLALITRSHRKNDRNDAMTLARLGSADLKLLNPVHHRDDTMQADLSVAQARHSLVKMRTRLVVQIRGMVKATGDRLPPCDAASFTNVRESVPEALRAATDPLFAVIESLMTQIKAFDRRIAQICKERYPETEVLTQIHGVGSLTALVFVLTLGEATRFKRSRDAAAFLGLCPRQHESGSLKKELGITKAGNSFARQLLVQAAHYVLGFRGEECDIRQWGLRIYERGGRCAKKRAAVAVARKLAVVMHRLYLSQEDYRPWRCALKAA